jgi:uncharacterized membrane protein
MSVVVNAFLLGTSSGLRAFLGLTVVSWAAYLGYLPMNLTWLAFLGFAFAPYILGLMAIGELVIDNLPNTPSRLTPPQFMTRVVTGTLCGIALRLSTSQLMVGGLAGWWVASLAHLGEPKVEPLAQNCLAETCLVY